LNNSQEIPVAVTFGEVEVICWVAAPDCPDDPFGVHHCFKGDVKCAGCSALNPEELEALAPTPELDALYLSPVVMPVAIFGFPVIFRPHAEDVLVARAEEAEEEEKLPDADVVIDPRPF
jgi:hypothetical protein